MSENKPTYEELEKRIRELEKEKTGNNKTLREERWRQDQQSRNFEYYKSMTDLLEIYLDENWHIISHSSNILLCTENIVELRKRGAHISELLREGDFAKINSYWKKFEKIRKLPFEKGRDWELRYRGPQDSEEIGEDWIPFSHSGTYQWKIESGRIIHHPGFKDEEDCYLMTADEYGSENEDVKVIFKTRTSKDKEVIRDLSLVLSGASGKLGFHPDLVGYTVCSGSNANTLGRIQKKGGNLIVVNEELEPDTEYQITAERTGGRLKREIVNLNTGEKGKTLEVIDVNVIYGKYNHIGFTTFSGGAEIFDIEIYTRESSFKVDQFRIPLNIEIGINDERIKDRRYSLKIGQTHLQEGSQYLLLLDDITERKRAEEKLSESEKSLKNAQRIGHVGSWDLNIVTGDLYWSDESYRIYGFQPQEFVPTYEKFLSILHPDDNKFVQEEINAALQNKKDYDIDFRFLYPNREIGWVHCEGEVTTDKKGKPIRFFGTQIDITKRKRVEDALRKSEGRLSEAQRVAHVGSWELDIKTHELLWSDETYRIFGFEKGEFGNTMEAFFETVHPDDQQHMSEVTEASWYDHKPFDADHRIILPSGEERTVHEQAEVIFDDAGQPVRMIGTVQDGIAPLKWTLS
ncbi:PAS domain-containing protein [Gemmatimonadota bacterium]